MKRKLTICLFLITVFASILAGTCYANSAEPPSIFIIVEHAPSDMEISIGGIEAQKNRNHTFSETQFSFYQASLSSDKNYTIGVSYSDVKYSLDINAPNQYSNIYTLDYEDKTITQGKSPWRSAKYIILRVIMTLLIEAIVFIAFKYRKKKEWISFLVINLITQGLLNLWLSCASSPWGTSYLIIALVIGEIFVLIAEIIAFLALIKDVPKWKTVLYVIAANGLSLFLGGYLLTVIPI